LDPIRIRSAEFGSDRTYIIRGSDSDQEKYDPIGSGSDSDQEKYDPIGFGSDSDQSEFFYNVKRLRMTPCLKYL
jgi:hypothetical protein